MKYGKTEWTLNCEAIKFIWSFIRIQIFIPTDLSQYTFKKSGHLLLDLFYRDYFQVW